MSGTWHTTAAAFAQFIVEQTAAALATDTPDDAPTGRSPATEAKLRAAGLID